MSSSSTSGKQDIAGKDQGSGNGNCFAKKTAGIERGRSLNGVQQEDKYIAIQYLNKTEPIRIIRPLFPLIRIIVSVRLSHTNCRDAVTMLWRFRRITATRCRIMQAEGITIGRERFRRQGARELAQSKKMLRQGS